MKKQIKFLSAILFLTLIIAVIGYAQKNEQPKAEKQYSVSLTVQEWELVVQSINNPKDITENQRSYLTNKIVPQVNKQLATDTTVNKKK